MVSFTECFENGYFTTYNCTLSSVLTDFDTIWLTNIIIWYKIISTRINITKCVIVSHTAFSITLDHHVGDREIKCHCWCTILHKPTSFSPSTVHCLPPLHTLIPSLLSFLSFYHCYRDVYKRQVVKGLPDTAKCYNSFK